MALFGSDALQGGLHIPGTNLNIGSYNQQSPVVQDTRSNTNIVGDPLGGVTSDNGGWTATGQTSTGLLGDYTGNGAYTYGSAAADAALYDQAIANANSGIGRLANQENISISNVENSYNSALNKLLAAKAIAQRDYNTTKDQNLVDNVNARSTIDFNTGRQANALQRLLGAHGSGRSTAAKFAAPYAAALQGTQQQRANTDSYAKNAQALDTNWGDYTRNYDTSVSDAQQQRQQNINNVKATILEKRNSLLSTLADLSAKKAALVGGNQVASAQPYLNQVNANNTAIDNLGRQFATDVTVSNPVYTAPELAQYNTNRPTAATVNSAFQSTVNPNYLSLLLGGKKKQDSNFAY